MRSAECCVLLLQALELYTEAIQLDSKMAAAYSNRALVHLKLSQPEAAEADCTHALELEPNNAKALLRRATARFVSTAGPILEASADAGPELYNRNSDRAQQDLWQLRQCQAEQFKHDSCACTLQYHLLHGSCRPGERVKVLQESSWAGGQSESRLSGGATAAAEQ